ncbi:MAG: glycosyltransferase [Sphaerochaetaceae bacterium]|jgi:processive 1,2-diacylglycerol beta-glucosyltransferase|nr:glycosyltransferase [Sphaerochaetaceae bacterium]MDD3164162.1 glycosyltransferase [Sphaerochaetaceae bacterium]MDD4007753.1 glycosyltransferase [Sphaerochaetaceae bacterium]MDD4396853.1 glycosyltransferase [Sphaerochaetaceae bacterium]
MKVLILSCNTGGGHNSVARAISEELEARGDQAQKIDVLSLESEMTSKAVCGIHTAAYRHFPRIYGLGYLTAEKHRPKQKKLRLKAVRRLYRILMDEHFDAVVSVHVFGALLMSRVREQYPCLVPSFFVATDYTCSPFVDQCKVDGFFIPHPLLLGEFEQWGIDAELLIPTGIPVRKEFFQRMDKSDARAVLGLPDSERIGVIAGGSMGGGKMAELCQSIVGLLQPGELLVVICGSNEKLRRRLMASEMSPRVKVIGFTNEMPLYMASCDVFITKAGGISTTEAMASGVNMVCLNSVPGCETRNFEFMTEHHLAAGASSAEEAAMLLHDPSWAASLSHDDFFSHDASKALCDEVYRRIPDAPPESQH